MKHLELKYRVASFDSIKQRLDELGASPSETAVTTHYYGQQKGSGVTKLVEYADRSEIHILDEADGKFSLRERIPVQDKTAGLKWLKDKGFSQVGVIKMECTDYAYKDGLVGLYTLNDATYSVILDFPDGEHQNIAQELRLDGAEVISAPYNVYLAKLGRLESLVL